MRTALQEKVIEKRVTETWQSLLTANCGMVTESGQSLRVLYLGKASDMPGSDFQDVMIDVGG